jgi:hypothetical protein
MLPNSALTSACVRNVEVSVQLGAGNKHSVTIVASVAAASEKLPWFLTAKGKTVRIVYIVNSRQLKKITIEKWKFATFLGVQMTIVNRRM